MVNRNLIRGIDADIEDWDAEIQTAMGDQSTEELFAPGDELDVNQIVTGNILRVDSEFVLVDVGYKSEGIIPRSEWEEDDEEPKKSDSRVSLYSVQDGTRDHPRLPRLPRLPLCRRLT